MGRKSVGTKNNGVGGGEVKKIKIPKELTSAIAINSYLVCMEEYLANKEKLKKKRRKARKYKVNEIKNNGGEK